MRMAKARVTSYRTGSEPRGGSAGLDMLEANQKADAANADAWVSGLSETALRGIAADLGKDLAWDRKDPVQRWKMARKAAVLRRLSGTKTSK